MLTELNRLLEGGEEIAREDLARLGVVKVVSEEEFLKDTLARVEAQIAKLERQQRDPYLDRLAEHFHLGIVGGSGRRMGSLNQRRAASLDKAIEIARELEPLYRERRTLQRRIAHIESGKRDLEQRAAQEIERRLRESKPGDQVMDSDFGLVTVIRVNRKTVTIETGSGYREARPYSLLAPLRPKAEGGALRTIMSEGG